VIAGFCFESNFIPRLESEYEAAPRLRPPVSCPLPFRPHTRCPSRHQLRRPYHLDRRSVMYIDVVESGLASASRLLWQCCLHFRDSSTDLSPDHGAVCFRKAGLWRVLWHKKPRHHRLKLT
jgi:hypothetical protein